MKALKSLLAVIRYLAAAFFIQIAIVIGFLVGVAAWGHFGSPWAGVAGFLLVIVPSVPIYGLLHGDTEPPA